MASREPPRPESKSSPPITRITRIKKSRQKPIAKCKLNCKMKVSNLQFAFCNSSHESGRRLKKRLQLFLAQFYRQLAAEVPVAVRLLVGVNDLDVKLNRLLPPLDEKFHGQLGADLETAFEKQPDASLREILHSGYPANLLGIGFGHVDRAIGRVARPDS